MKTFVHYILLCLLINIISVSLSNRTNFNNKFNNNKFNNNKFNNNKCNIVEFTNCKVKCNFDGQWCVPICEKISDNTQTLCNCTNCSGCIDMIARQCGRMCSDYGRLICDSTCENNNCKCINCRITVV